MPRAWCPVLGQPVRLGCQVSLCLNVTRHGVLTKRCSKGNLVTAPRKVIQARLSRKLPNYSVVIDPYRRQRITSRSYKTLRNKHPLLNATTRKTPVRTKGWVLRGWSKWRGCGNSSATRRQETRDTVRAVDYAVTVPTNAHMCTQIGAHMYTTANCSVHVCICW